jgi:hypothetical protein
MSLSPNEKYPGATEADPNYKDSKFKDNNPSTTNNGSPLKALDRNEQLALQEAMMNAAGFDYNGVVDTPQNSQMFAAYKAALSNGANLLSNHNFTIASPDDSQPAPSATPTSYPPGYEIFSGVFANETTGILNLTYIDGRVSFSGGDFYMAVPNTGALKNITEFVVSVADFDGKPRTRGVSYSLVGDEYRVIVGVEALEDESANETLLGSVKFEQGSVATGHELDSGVISEGSTNPRTLYSRFSDNYTIDDFRKVGDRITDDTQAFDRMLSSGNARVSLRSKRTYYVRGDVLYVRRFQQLDLNGSIVKLIDYQDDAYRGTILEMQDYASVINGEIDGNYQNNNFDMDTWRDPADNLLDVAFTPTAHGLRTGTAGTRTDGNIVPSFKCYIDRVIVRNTIRSNILLSEDSSVGIVYLFGSLCDHHIYFSSARGAYVEYAYCEGPSNSDAISVSSTGESTDLQIGKLKLKNCTMTPWRANSSNNADKYGSRWIECRENTDGLGLRSTLSIGIVEIDDTTADPTELFDTNRRFRFRDWHVSIDSLVVRTQLAGENLNFEPIFPILDVRNETTSVNIQNMHVEINDTLAMSYPVRAINANEGSAVNVGNLTGNLNAPNAGTGDNGLGWTRCIDSSITIGAIDTLQSQGDVFWCRVANKNANITVTNNNGTEGYTRPIYNFSSDPELVAKFKQIQSKHEVRPVGDITGNTTIDGFNVETVDLALATGTLQGFKDGYIGQEITVIWNGVCDKAGGNVRWQTTTPAIPTDGSVSKLRLGQHNGGMWVETSFTAM